MNIQQQFTDLLGESRVLCAEPLSRHTTFRIGGPADYFLMPSTPEEMTGILKICAGEDLPVFILGNGSNLLVSDEGYRGVVIQIYRNWQDVRLEDHTIHARAGALLSRVSAMARDEGLTGLEFAGGIPGTVGGAVMMNAGAYGGEMKDVLVRVRAMSKDGTLHTYQADELELGYRRSRFSHSEEIVLEAELSLKQGDPDLIRERMQELNKERSAKQPLDLPSAGSTFKRPEGYFAGKLIMDAGLKGLRIGDAQVSEKHCGFVVNVGNATAADVYALIRRIQETVYRESGVMLEPEVRMLGEFPCGC